MIKVFALLPKRPDLSHEQFHRHWQDVHAPLVLKNPSLKRYIQSHVLPQPFPGFPADIPYQGVAELWFDDLETAMAQFNRSGDMPESVGHALRDEANFLDAAGPTLVLTQENIVIPGPPVDKDTQLLKALFFVKHKHGKDRHHFQNYWRHTHAPLVIGTPDLQRYVQCHVLSEADAIGQAAYDGVGELWFANDAAYQRCWSSPEIQVEQLPDTLNFVGRDPIGFFVEEVRLRYP